MGLPDDCYEITQLRKLRDTYMLGHDDHKLLLEEYKIVGPQMLQNIFASDNKKEI